MLFQLNKIDYESKRNRNIDERKMFIIGMGIESKRKEMSDFSEKTRQKVAKKAKISGPIRKSNRIQQKIVEDKENIKPQCSENGSEKIPETQEKTESIPEDQEKVKPNSMSIYEFKFQNFEIGNLHLNCSSFAHPTASLEHFDK